MLRELMLAAIIALPAGAQAAKPVRTMTLTDLQCEYQQNPLGLDVHKPRLGWKLVSTRRDERQSAYHVVVASDEAKLLAGKGDLWDSGKVASDESVHVVYAGAPLKSRQRVWWRVRVWDDRGADSGWSAPATWEMGLLDRSDWRAKWIGRANVEDHKIAGPCPYLRKGFEAAKPIAQARIYASALGVYQLFLNGKRVSDDVFRPGWTDYRKRIQYQTYDVTALLHQGANAIGMTVGDGWYCGHIAWAGRNCYGPVPQGLAELRIDYKDGTSETIVSDETWKESAGPILMSDMLEGEDYDARKEMTGWSAPGFDDSAWHSAEAQPIGDVPLVAQYDQPVRRTGLLHPITVSEKPQGSYIFDLGQNMVGWARLKVSGQAGQQVRIRYAEVLNPDGTIYTTNLRKARATDNYTLSGKGEEVYEPSFTFHGFRYVELTGYPGTPGKDAVEGVVAHTDAPHTNDFECSSPMVNQIQHNIVWGQKGNYLEVPTDCPQRDERLGWMGDAQIFVRTGAFNMNIARFMTKWTRDMEDAQSHEGGYSDVSPRMADPADGAPAWADAGMIVPWTIYLHYGDKRILETHYDSMKRYIGFIDSANPDHRWIHRSSHNFGDWLSIHANTPPDVLATAYFAYSTWIMQQTARVLGREDDTNKYRDLYMSIWDAFNQHYVDADGKITGDTQTCYVLPLAFGLLNEKRQAQAVEHLARNLEQHEWLLSTGFVGTGYLLPILSRYGRTDVAYRLLNNDRFPSWGYEIKNGATTIWERWDGWTTEKGFQDPGMNSFNHYAFGAVGEWMYHTVAGIDIDPEHPGFKHIVMRPQPGGGLSWAKDTYHSLYGPIISNWKLVSGRFEWAVAVPPNTTATVYVPTSDASSVTEGGKPAAHAEGVRFAGHESGFAVYKIGSGHYTFSAAEPAHAAAN
jgi:alpha-L-rhamnosidase